ncbi:DNA N-6-adenine-methyltransferase [Nitrosopumilus sp.]|uniref:DNA N-6-adenine-methyltransferase n=1 Tax=Nitrosopumilus sp. TaxID=2024843 RepID=UPI00292D617D|nr:DNA N-6-adenine-methyltransferase [Nitrosopumilus sp.]
MQIAQQMNIILTKEIDYEIKQDFFMNPPYSRVSEFMKFAYSQHIKNNVSCIILTYSKTGTKWWHKYVQGIADRLDFQRGRISFLDENGNKTKHGAPYDSVYIVFEKRKSN